MEAATPVDGITRNWCLRPEEAMRSGRPSARVLIILAVSADRTHVSIWVGGLALAGRGTKVPMEVGAR